MKMQIIMCGEFNLVLNLCKVSQNYVNINRSNVITMPNERDLVYIYRVHNPDVMQFTWRRRNVIKQARLDYFTISSSVTDCTSVMQSYTLSLKLTLTLMNLSMEKATGNLTIAYSKSKLFGFD